MLTIDPRERPSVEEVLSRLQALAQQENVDLGDAAFAPAKATPDGKFF